METGELIADLAEMADTLVSTGVEAFTEIVTVALPFIIAIGVFFMVYRMVTGRLS